MGRRLFVGNLAYDVTEAKIKEAFAAAGKVATVRMIIDRETNRFKGFAFVEMSTDAEATAAIQTLNNKEVAGRRMIVSEARPVGERPAPRPGGPGGPGGFRPGGPPRPGGGAPSGPIGAFNAPRPDFGGDRGPRRGKAEWEKRRDERERASRESRRGPEKEKRGNPKYDDVGDDDGDDF